MKCFYHHEAEAVALCKSCSRALCAKCAADVHPGTACIDRCEQDVEELNIVIEKGKAAYKKSGEAFKKTGKVYKRNAFIIFILGLIFIMVGIAPIIVGGNFGA